MVYDYELHSYFVSLMANFLEKNVIILLLSIKSDSVALQQYACPKGDSVESHASAK